MYQAVLFFIIKYAELIRPRLQGKPAPFVMAELADKGCRCYAQELGNLLYFISLYKDAAFAVTTSSAHLAFKCFQNEVPEVEDCRLSRYS